jgi:type 1 glutamine amidotransferase
MRTWRTVILGLVCLLGWVSAATAEDAKPVRVLMVLGSPPFHKVFDFGDTVSKTLQDLGGFEVTRLEPRNRDKPADSAHLSKLAKLSPSDYDVVLFYTSVMELTQAEEHGLQKFLGEGGGIVALHGASLSFPKSQFWTHLIGARFKGHIPGTHKLNIVIVDREHPITKGVPDFQIVDEEYKHNFINEPKHVLARFRERPKGSDQSENMDILWTRHIGRGRMFYSALGHDKEAWTNPDWQKLIAQGLCWAAGRPRVVEVRGVPK